MLDYLRFVQKTWNAIMSYFSISPTRRRVQRVRGLLLTPRGTLLFIKRVKPYKPAPYWVAPGGGVEAEDANLHETLDRELYEELGARVTILREVFVLEHEKGGKDLEEHFFLCKLVDYDLSQRHGPEFDDPSRGQYIPDEIPLEVDALQALELKTPEMRDWILDNLPMLRRMAR